MQTLQEILLVLFILGLSAWLTQLYVRYAYRSCRRCGTLNARRRSHCRSCSHPLT